MGISKILITPLAKTRLPRCAPLLPGAGVNSEFSAVIVGAAVGMTGLEVGAPVGFRVGGGVTLHAGAGVTTSTYICTCVEDSTGQDK